MFKLRSNVFLKKNPNTHTHTKPLFRNATELRVDGEQGLNRFCFISKQFMKLHITVYNHNVKIQSRPRVVSSISFFLMGHVSGIHHHVWKQNPCSVPFLFL